jgi:hypothetical protein
MKSKLKECDGCQKMTVIWKNSEGFKYTFEKRINSLTAWKDKHFFKPFKQQKQ